MKIDTMNEVFVAIFHEFLYNFKFHFTYWNEYIYWYFVKMIFITYL